MHLFIFVYPIKLKGNKDNSSKRGIFVTIRNNFNEFWDFYYGISVPAGSPKATQDTKYPVSRALSGALSGLDKCSRAKNPVVLCRTMQGRMCKKTSKTNRTELNGGCR
jgi:hypothetical protein